MSEVAGVALPGRDENPLVESVACDSRSVQAGSLFVCLRGSRHDGHEFVAEAVSRGAVAVLCERGRSRPQSGATVYEADDPLSALAGLANLVRRKASVTVVGVAGAAGKTTTKDVLCSLLEPIVPTIASPASYNNTLGVSLTLLGLDTSTRACVSELGTSGRGDLTAVCRIAEPDVAVLTAIGPEHLDGLGSVAGAAAAEAEIIQALRPGSPLILPHDEPLLDAYRRGRSGRVDVRS